MNLFFVSLGCDKNLVDSEKMIALLASQNISVTSTPEDAEIIIVNTCGFIHDAKEESIETILEMAEYKKTGKCVSLIMTGCLAQRYADDIQKEIPAVDAGISWYGCVAPSPQSEFAFHQRAAPRRQLAVPGERDVQPFQRGGVALPAPSQQGKIPSEWRPAGLCSHSLPSSPILFFRFSASRFLSASFRALNTMT